MAKPAKQRLTPSWSLVGESARLVKAYAEQLVLIALLPGLVLSLGTLLQQDGMETLGAVLALVGLVWLIVNLVPSIRLQLAAVRGQAITTGECYRGSGKYLGRIIGFSVLYTLLILIGLVLLIVPGLIVLRRYMLTYLYIVDKDMRVGEAMRTSAKQSVPVAGYLWGIVGVSVVIFVAAYGLGFLVSVIPGAPVVLTTAAAALLFFLRALRYQEIVKTAKVVA